MISGKKINKTGTLTNVVIDENKMYYSTEEIEEALNGLDWTEPDFMISNNPQKDALLFRVHAVMNPYAVLGYHDGRPSGETVLATPRYGLVMSCVDEYDFIRQKNEVNWPRKRQNGFIPRYSFVSIFKASQNNAFTRDTGITDGAPFEKLKEIKGDTFTKEHYETALIPGENPRIGLYLACLFSRNDMRIASITCDSKIYDILRTNEVMLPGSMDLSYKFEPNWEKLDFANNLKVSEVAAFKARQAEKIDDIKFAKRSKNQSNVLPSVVSAVKGKKR